MIFDSNEMQDILKKFAVQYCGQEDNEELQTKLNKYWYKRYA
jgi:hypothetical protein